MPTPEGQLTTSQLWSEPTEIKETIVEEKEDELSDKEG